MVVDKFLIYADWLDKIYNVIDDQESRNRLAMAIMHYGIRGEYPPDFELTGAEKMFLAFVCPQIDKAKSNYQAKVENGRINGRSASINYGEIARLAKEGVKAKEIAQILGVSVDSVYHSDAWKNRNL